MKYDKKDIFKKAWNLARNCARIYKDKASKFIAWALKYSWNYAKRNANTVVIPNWFIQQKLGYGLGVFLRRAYVERETQKAVFVNMGGEMFWCPKSILEK